MSAWPFVSLVLTYFYAVAATSISRTSSNIWYFFFVVLLILFSGFRYGVGTDYWTYVDFINAIRNGGETYMEPGFEFIVFLLDSPRLVFLFSSCVTVLSFALYFYFFSPHFGLSVGLFFLLPIFFVASFNGVRQFIAVGLFLISLKAVSDRKFVVYVLLVLMAALFHKSAIMLFPLYFFLSRKVNIVAFVGSLIIVVIFVEFLPAIASFIGFSDKYFKGQFIVQSVNYKSLIVVPIYLLVLFLYKKIDVSPEVKNISVNMLGISSVLVMVPMLTDIHSSILLRFSTYFTPALLVIIPALIKSYNARLIRGGMVLVLLIVSIYYYFSVIVSSGEYYSLTPYCTDFLSEGEFTCFQ